MVPYMDDLTILIRKIPVDLDQIEGWASAKLAEFFTSAGLNIAAEKTARSDGKGSILGVPFENG